MTDNTSSPAAAKPPVLALHSILDHRLHWRLMLPLLLLLALFPTIANALNEGFYIGVASRVLIFALAAASLNFILGFGGMVSFGHAAFVGLGAYTVGVLAQQGLTSAWLAWPLAAVMGALFALLVGAISLRTQGVYFIMITLAFAQMLYYVAVSVKAYGGDDGLAMAARRPRNQCGNRCCSRCSSWIMRAHRRFCRAAWAADANAMLRGDCGRMTAAA